MCATISLKVSLPEPPLPAVTIAVTRVRIDPEDLFKVADSGCGSNNWPLCQPGSFAFTIDRTECVVPVRATGPIDSKASLILDGRPICPTGQDAFCGTFVPASPDESVDLSGPEQPEEGSPGEEQTTATDSTSSNG